MPPFSLCMGNQARLEDHTTVFSISMRNFSHRLDRGSRMELGSAEFDVLFARLGRIPAAQEWLPIVAEKIDPGGEELYRCFNFDQIRGSEVAGRLVGAYQEARVLPEASGAAAVGLGRWAAGRREPCGGWRTS